MRTPTPNALYTPGCGSSNTVCPVFGILWNRTALDICHLTFETRMATLKRPTAAPLIPCKPNLNNLVESAAHCGACDLWKKATQTVFGQGGPRVRGTVVAIANPADSVASGSVRVEHPRVLTPVCCAL